MKKVLFLIICLILLSVIVLPVNKIEAAKTTTVTVTAAGQYLGITNSQTLISFTNMRTASTYTWGGSKNYSILSNIGNVPLSIMITGDDLVGGTNTWTLGVNPGDQVYALRANPVNNNIYNRTITTNGGIFLSSIAGSEARTWSMLFMSPTSYGAGYTGSALTGTITISAAAF